MFRGSARNPGFYMGPADIDGEHPPLGLSLHDSAHNSAFEYRSSVASPDIMCAMKIQASLGLHIVLCAVIAGCAAAPPAPAPLRVPADQSLIKQLHATGVQIYECQAAKNDPVAI